jgi:hypothetical protein
MKQDQETPDLPNESNYFASVHTKDRDAVTTAFKRDDHWTIRKAGFEEFEARSRSGELIIEAQRPVLIHGPLHPDAVTRVNAILSSIGRPWNSEFYDSEGNLVQNFGDGTT